MTDVLNAGAEPTNELSLRDELAAQFEKMSAEPTSTAPTETVDDTTQPELAGSDRARDELGRFAPKTAQESEGTPPVAKETTQQPTATTEPAKATEEGAAKYAGPPPGWSVASKAAFDALPDAVKADIAKREQEIDKGFAKLREFKDIERALEPHQQMARQYGVDLPEMLTRFHNAETFLQRDPINGLKWLCQNYRVDPRQLMEGTAPAQPGQQPQPQNGAVDPALQPLLDEIASLKQQVGRVKTIEETLYTDKYNSTLSEIERFGADPKNKFFENVADQMVTLIKQANASGQPVVLASIYETACYMNPEVRQALINERLTADQRAAADKAKAAANQARNAGSSISGGSAVTQATTEPDSENLRALLEHNFAAQLGRT